MPASRTFLSQSFQSFGDISRFLREGVADEDSRQLRDSLGALSNAIEEAVRIRRTSTDTQLIHRTATALFQGVREHQRLLPGLGSGWHTLYEFGVYQRALWELGQSVSTWKEALLLIDMYEQGSRGEGGAEPPAPSRSRSWWERALRWLGR